MQRCSYSNRSKVLELFADILDYPAPGLADKAAECAALVGGVQPQAATLLGSLPRLRRGASGGQAAGSLQRFF